MTQPEPSKIYNVVCPACLTLLGKVLGRYADRLVDEHQNDCTATAERKQAAAIDVQFACLTGDTSALENALERHRMEGSQ